jgi:hypothetical protein
MDFDFSRFGRPALDEGYVRYLVEEEMTDRATVFRRLWAYYRNELDGLAGDRMNTAGDDWAEVARPYVQDQEFGLPARITGLGRLGYGATTAGGEQLRRKEVVIENDIGWRIDTLVHFLFGQSPRIVSLAGDGARARRIEQALQAVYDANGGVSLWQEAALLGAVFGFVDLVVRPQAGLLRRGAEWFVVDGDGERPIDPLTAVRVEPIEAVRAAPVLNEDDYRRIDGYVLHYTKLLNRVAGTSVFEPAGYQASCTATEILGADWWQYYEDGELAAEGPNLLGRVPVVHIQNLPVPGNYEGAGEVEPLIPLQDELNTRLSDRATRVTFQSFKMYLGRGIENFENRPIAPGRMWATDNPEASIEAFGGDAESPSEDAHIAQLREAMDKTSGVTPLAAGLLRDRLGRLTSAAALRVTMMGTLARLQRKRVTYGDGMVRLNEMVLELLDRLGVVGTAPEERRTRIEWPNPLPDSRHEELSDAKLKLDLGVPRETVLRELGYDL